MSGLPSVIIVHKSEGGYRVSVRGRFGGGFATTRAGVPSDVAPFVAAQIQRYSMSNPHGGSLIAPPEIRDLIPEAMRDMPARKKAGA